MRERIITGDAKFDLLARIYSVDGSALHGGEMEPATLQTFVQPFADALSELKPGQISEVVETQYGFHLIQLIDKKGNLYHCRHILIRPTYTTEELSEPDRQLDSIAGLIRADSLTFEEAALRFSDDPYSRQNGGIVTNHELLEHYNANDARYTATKFLKEDFGNMGPSAIADFRTLSQLKVGDISPAYQTQDMNGNQLSKIVKLVQIIPTARRLAQRGLPAFGADGAQPQAGEGFRGVALQEDRRHVRLHRSRVPRRGVRQQTLGKIAKAVPRRIRPALLRCVR